MNNLDKEYMTLLKKTSDQTKEDERETIQFIKESGGIIKVEEDGHGNLVYTCKNGDTCYIDLFPRLYDGLVMDKEIEPVELTAAEKADLFAVPVMLDRVKAYIQKLRNEIAMEAKIA